MLSADAIHHFYVAAVDCCGAGFGKPEQEELDAIFARIRDIAGEKVPIVVLVPHTLKMEYEHSLSYPKYKTLKNHKENNISIYEPTTQACLTMSRKLSELMNSLEQFSYKSSYKVKARDLLKDAVKERAALETLASLRRIHLLIEKNVEIEKKLKDLQPNAGKADKLLKLLTHCTDALSSSIERNNIKQFRKTCFGLLPIIKNYARKRNRPYIDKLSEELTTWIKGLASAAKRDRKLDLLSNDVHTRYNERKARYEKKISVFKSLKDIYEDNKKDIAQQLQSMGLKKFPSKGYEHWRDEKSDLGEIAVLLALDNFIEHIKSNHPDTAARVHFTFFTHDNGAKDLTEYCKNHHGQPPKLAKRMEKIAPGAIERLNAANKYFDTSAISLAVMEAGDLARFNITHPRNTR
ncbi:MAG: hypothetical protein ACK5XX_08640 [Holosporales bacterium]